MAITALLATVDDIADRVGEEITSPADISMARAFLRKASAEARHHGLPWTDPILVPEVVVTTVIEAAARGYLNPEGFGLERGDEITLQRQDDFAVGSALTRAEIVVIRAAAGKTGLYSVQMVRDVSPAPSHAGVLFTNNA